MMVLVKDLFRDSSQVLIGSRDSSLWFNNWQGDGPILDDHEKGQVEDVQINEVFSNAHGWNLNFVNSWVPIEACHKVLKARLFLEDDRDKIIWFSSSSGLVTTKQAFEQIRRRKGTLLSRKHIWSARILIKKSCLVCKILNRSTY
ncbi:hypothetical protein ACH5RR_040977 [Cinchona calisaya]|uniref:Uncharacterized protein n=1 Tax=Cinchona calisaya TaxID=153742 RepID=A0ABD2XVM7_9GENT